MNILLRKHSTALSHLVFSITNLPAGKMTCLWRGFSTRLGLFALRALPLTFSPTRSITVTTTPTITAQSVYSGLPMDCPATSSSGMTICPSSSVFMWAKTIVLMELMRYLMFTSGEPDANSLQPMSLDISIVNSEGHWLYRSDFLIPEKT